MKLFENAADINKAIASIAGRGAKLDKDIHVAGVSVLAHATKHGDTTCADRLVHAMPKGSRKLALVEWMLAHGQVSLLDKVADKDAIASGRVFRLDREKQYDEAAAIENVWTEYRKEPSIQDAFDAQKAVQSVLKRLQAAAQAGKTIEHKREALAEAEALVIALK